MKLIQILSLTTLIISLGFLTSGCIKSESGNKIGEAMISRMIYEEALSATQLEPTLLNWDGIGRTVTIDADRNRYYRLPSTDCSAGCYVGVYVSTGKVEMSVSEDEQYKTVNFISEVTYPVPGSYTIDKSTELFVKVYGITDSEFTIIGTVGI